MDVLSKLLFTCILLLALLAGLFPVGNAALPDPGKLIERARPALVINDPQNDFLSPGGVTRVVVGKSVEAKNKVQNIEALQGNQ